MRKALGSIAGLIALTGFVIWLLAGAALTFFPAARAAVSPLVCEEGSQLNLTSQYCTSTEGGCFEFYCEGSGVAREVTGVFFAGFCGSMVLLVGVLLLSERLSPSKPEVLYPPPEP